MKISTMAAVAILAVFVATAAHGAPVAIGAMSITAGSFFQETTMVSPIPFDCIGPNTNLVAGYIGNGGLGRAVGDPDPSRIVGFDFAPGLPVNIYTAAANLGDTNSPAGTIPGGPVPSGVVDATNGTVTLDLSSWFGNAGDADSPEGSAAVSGSWDPVTHAYSLSWDVVPAPGLFVTNTWTLQGLAHPVPEPSAALLVLSAVGMLAATRRLQNQYETRRDAGPEISRGL